MATGTKVSALNPDTTPTSDDLLLVVNDPLGTPGSKKATTANVITKAHGLSDGMIEVAGGVMGVATAGTDYTSPSSTETFTNKTYDTAGTGNSLSINGVAATANTGTGAVVRDTSPTLVTPTLGVASATTVNKIALTTPATGSTLTIADGQTLTVNGSATITNGTHSGTNTGDEVVAIGSELDTGTDDVKYASALALKNSHNVPSVVPGTSGNLLRSDGTDWTSVTIDFAKPTYNAVVAPSGGDYTTVSAAIAAASSGWTIRVMPGTYTEAGFTTALTDITVDGLGWGGTILQFSTNSAVFSGTGLNLSGINLDFSTGALTCSGANAVIDNIYFSKSSTGGGFYLQGTKGVLTNSRIINTSTTTGANTETFSSTGTYSRISNCYFKSNDINTTANTGAIRIHGASTQITNCLFELNSGNNNTFISLKTQVSFVGNHVENLTSSGTTGAMVDLTTNVRFVGNIVLGLAQTSLAVSGSNLTIGNNNIYSKNCILVYGTSSFNTVSGNYIRPRLSGSYGIDFGSQIARGWSITGNSFDDGDTGIRFNSPSQIYNNVADNTFNTGLTTPIVDSGVATFIGGNTGLSTLFEKEYSYMKNTSGGTINAGDIVTFKAVAAGNEVTTTTTASDNLVFGVAAASISSNAYGYIQTSGKTTLLKVNGTTDIAVGDFITTYTTAGIGAKATAGMLGTTPGDLAIAIALEAYTANDSSGVIDALIIEPRRL